MIIITTFGQLLQEYTNTGELRSMLILSGILIIGFIYLFYKSYQVWTLSDGENKPLKYDPSRQLLIAISSGMGVLIVVVFTYASFYLQKDLLVVMDENLSDVMIETLNNTKSITLNKKEVSEVGLQSCYNNFSSKCYEVTGQLDGVEIKIYTKDYPYNMNEFKVVDISDEESKHISKLYTYLSITSYITILGSDIGKVKSYRDMLKFVDKTGDWYIAP